MEKTQKKRREIIGTTLDHLVREGFRNSGIRALAKSVGISDRMLIHYFGTKEELIKAALLALAEGFTASLDAALPAKTTSGKKIVAAMVRSALEAEGRPALELWLEVVGLAVRGDEPYQSVARLFLDQWEQWITDKLPADQKHRASDILARIEGEVMLKLLRS